MNYSYDWIKTIYEYEDYSSKKRFVPYPLQFANCKRLEFNDDVYIFDEVGTGKTISSGLMAMHYAYNRNKIINLNYIDVLVITDYRMVEINEYGGQNRGKFIRDWERIIKFDKLKLSQNITYDFKNRVQIVNRHHLRISDYIGKKIGLLIIDEAHRFIQDFEREDSQMYNALKELAAEKVVCMTATPIRYNSNSDIRQLIYLANNILYNYNNKGIDENEFYKNIIRKKQDKILNSLENTRNDLICASFDYKNPITRYFKDTVKALRYGTFKKTKSKRYEPIKWSVGETEKKEEVLIEHIREIFKNDQHNRFLVFVREISEEIIIRDILKKDYIEYDGNNNNQKSFWVANSKNKDLYNVTDFEDGRKNIPDILVVTSGLVEAGVSLPGYNYVVNYSISSLPASIEQRFGRIDRIDNSEYEDIKNVFLINSNSENDLKNFKESFDSFYNQLRFGKLPSKNIIFNGETLSNLKKYQMQELLNIRIILGDYLKNNYHKLDDQSFKLHFSNIIKPRIETITKKKNSCDTYEEFESSIKKYIDNESKRIKDKYDEMMRKFHNKGETVYESDKILYCNADGELYTIDAITECTDLIKGGENYMKYLEEYKSEMDIYEKFNEETVNRELINEIEAEIENEFKNNLDGSEQIFMKEENGTICKLNDIVDLIHNNNIKNGKKIDDFSYNFIKWNYTIIPFYKMCECLSNVINNEYIEKYPELKEEEVRDAKLEKLKKEVLYNDQILSSLWDLFVENLINENIELSYAFKYEYFSNVKIKELRDLFYVFIKYDESIGKSIIDISPWFKLFFCVINNNLQILKYIDENENYENDKVKIIRNNYFKFIFSNLKSECDYYITMNDNSIYINSNIASSFIDLCKRQKGNDRIYLNEKVSYIIKAFANVYPENGYYYSEDFFNIINDNNK